MLRTSLLITALVLTGCNKKKKSAVVDVVEQPAPDPVLGLKEMEGPTTTEEAVAQLEANFSRVFFGFDSSELGPEAMTHLEKNAAILQQHPQVRVEIHGHADERGTVDYNLALAMKRAEKVRSTLGNMGVSKDRLSVISFGEEKPLTQGSQPRVWSMNRRAEFAVVVDPDGMVDGTLDDPLPPEEELVIDGPSTETTD